MTIEEGYYNAVIGGVRVVDNRFGQDGKEIEIKVGLFDKDNKPTYIATTADGKFTVTGDENTRPSDVVIKLSNAMRGK